MARAIAGVAGALVAWIVAATLGNLALRLALPGYAEAEKAMVFTLAMLAGRLAVGAISSYCAGAAVGWIAKGNLRAAMIAAGILVALFIPVHYNLWTTFPLWYHFVFFASLVVLTVMGARLYAR